MYFGHTQRREDANNSLYLYTQEGENTQVHLLGFAAWWDLIFSILKTQKFNILTKNLQPKMHSYLISKCYKWLSETYF